MDIPLYPIIPQRPRFVVPPVLLFVWILLVSSIYWSPPLQAQTEMQCHHFEPAMIPREHPLDIQRVRLEVRFEPEAGKVIGQVTHHFQVLRKSVDSVFFDAPGIDVQEVYLGGKQVRYELTDEGVVLFPEPALHWDHQDSIQFIYEAQPRKGIYFVGWNDDRNLSRKQIWTQGQGIDHRHWIPCYDDANDKVITETIVTFDEAYRVLSNGNLISERDNGDGTRTWHHRISRPHALYLLMLAIGKYDVRTLKTQSGIPVHLWYYPEWEDRFETTYRYSTECIDFMEEHTGIPYPWDSYAQVPVQDFIYGAMENTTATIFGDFFCVDRRGFYDRNYINVNVHELTHQWFGDYITHRSPAHIWLHESFATFYPKLFLREVYGESYYQWQRRGEQRSALRAAERDNYPIFSTKGGVARFYPKGSAVLDMMLYVFGEEAYQRVIEHYLKKHAYGLVETNDLYQSFQDTLGLAPHWFFDQWIYRGGEPHYHVSWQDIRKQGQRQTQVTVRQIHQRNDLVKLFRMPVVFEVHYQDGTVDRVQQTIAEETEQVTVPNTRNQNIAFVLFDPGGYILKQVTFPKSPSELERQALKAPEMIDRYDALKAMEDIPAAEKRVIMGQVFDRESFHATKSEIVRQLIDDDHGASREIIRKAIRDPDHLVRRSTLEHTDRIPSDLAADYELLLTDSSYTTVLLALEKLSSRFPENNRRYLKLTDKVFGGGNKVRIKWLEINALEGSDKDLDRLVDYASNAWEFRTRQNAMQALKRLNYLDATLISHLIDAWLNPNRRLAGVAREVLDYFSEQQGYARMIEAYLDSHDWEDWEQDLLQRWR